MSQERSPIVTPEVLRRYLPGRIEGNGATYFGPTCKDGYPCRSLTWAGGDQYRCPVCRQKTEVLTLAT